MNETTEHRPFDTAAADDVVNRARSMGPEDKIALVLKIRAPEDDFASVLDECWAEIEAQAELVGVALSEFDSALDAQKGQIHLRADMNLARLLSQRDDYFWSVAYDDSRWG